MPRRHPPVWLLDLDNTLWGGDVADPARTFKGCMSRATLDFATGQFAKLLTSWQCTDIADVAPADTAFSEPAAGHALVCANNSFSALESAPRNNLTE